MKKARADAVIVQASLTRKAAAELALKHRLPAVSFSGLFPKEGGLLSYSANQDDVFRRSAHYDNVPERRGRVVAWRTRSGR
jgi:putative tryptophan/tyrosine transport system substrate-binding protein